MDRESIILLNEITEELNRICKENDCCATCNIKRFKEKYDIECDLCMRTFIAQYLLGDKTYKAQEGIVVNAYGEFVRDLTREEKDACTRIRMLKRGLTWRMNTKY